MFCVRIVSFPRSSNYKARLEVRVACLLPSSAPKPFTHYSLKSLKKLNKKHEYKTYEHAQTRSPVTLSTNNDLRKRHLKSVMH
jgi:hypothetical protein